MNYTVKTGLIDPNSIIIPKDYIIDTVALTSMVSSIEELGLQNPPAIKENHEVITGRLRITACIACKLDPIEVKIYPSDLPEEEYKIISLHENLKRYNLPWHEQVIKEAQLHSLRQVQHGPGKQGKKTGWGLRDTATELNISLGYLSEDIRMAEAIMADPSLKKIGDKTTARRVILGKLKRINQEVDSTRHVNFETNKIYCGSSEVILQGFPDNTFDVCLTDPPWLEYRDDKLIRDEFTLSVFSQVYRVMKNNSFLYMFVSTQDWIFYQAELHKLGFSVQKYPLIWIKEGVLSYGTRSWEYQRDYEPILLAVKGSPSLTGNMISSIMSCKVVPSQKLIHPNEKPAEVIKRLLNSCSYEGSLVLDPFMGSGVVVDVCRQIDRRYIGIERDQKAFLKIEERLK